MFVGYSDITVLHEAFAVRAGFATLHGPMAATEVFLRDAATREHLRATLFAPETVRTLGLESAGALVPGRARGVLYGGCVSLLAAGTGAPGGRTHARGGLLVIEDTGEEPYRLDGILTRLLRSGALDGVAGVACGSWQECGPYEKIRAVLADRLGPLGIPVVEELGFGHGPTALTIPLGVPAVLDAPHGRRALHADRRDPGPALTRPPPRPPHPVSASCDARPCRGPRVRAAVRRSHSRTDVCFRAGDVNIRQEPLADTLTRL